MDVAPITLSWPLGLALHITPLQNIPLPARIRTRIMEHLCLKCSLFTTGERCLLQNSADQ